jgi:CubicO group peptidase (beta-lactamase class C family)
VLVAEWGEPQRVDMTHSVTKSFLSSVVGLAYDGGMLRSVDDPARDYMAPIQLYNPLPAGNRAERMGAPDLLDLFATPHNRTITWNHLLRQTSDWEGVLWGKPDWADRPTDKPDEWLTRPRNQAGAVYKYNDTRVNVLALATLNIWRRPLPQVLKEKIMDPIGASNTWRWFGYDNAWVVIDGQPVQSVTGGGHWGGGMFINAYDMARFGYLTLRRGKWGDRQLLSEKWVSMALTPTGGQSPYGFINYFLNTDRKQWPSAPASAFMHNGNGLNMVYVDPENDLVAVVRWIDNNAVDGFLKRLIAAVAAKS